MALMMQADKKPEQKEWAIPSGFSSNAGDRGSHVNISGMAIAKHAPNKANALKLMEFLPRTKRRRLCRRPTTNIP